MSSREAVELPALVPEPPPKTPPRSPAQVAEHYFAKSNDLRWPALSRVVLAHASLDASNPHASKLNAAVGALALPNSTTYSPLLDCLFEPGEPLSKGLRVDQFPEVGTEQCVVMLGPSGSGKTRKALEFLRDKNGLYLTHRDANDKNHGSFALSEVVSETRLLKKVPHIDWTTKVIAGGELSDPLLSSKRRDVVHFAIRCVLAAYQFVLEEWQRVINSRGDDPTNLPNPVMIPSPKWLLVQMFPRSFFNVDVFRELALELFAKLDPSDENVMRMPTGPCVIDEAHVFGKVLEGMFNTRTVGARATPRPLLSAIISGMDDALGRFPVILGTGLSLTTDWDTLTSAAATDDTSRFIFNDFLTLKKNEVRAFLVRLLNCEDDPRLDEVCEWLVGRPRWTTYFVKIVIAERKTVSEVLDSFVERMTNPENTTFRGPAYFIKQLRDKPASFSVAGTSVPNPHTSMLMDAYFVSMGQPPRMAKSPALIELGLGYAAPVGKSDRRDPGVDALVNDEALVLEAARRSRELLPTLHTEKLHDLQDSATAMGERFEYIASEHVLAALCHGKLENNALFGNLEESIPEGFKGEWEFPAWRCGHWAMADGDAFPDKILAALDPNADVVRVWFPDNNAGPDLFALVRDTKHERVMLVLVQYKLAIDVNMSEALLRVDPSKLYHVNRGKPPGNDKGQEHVRQGKKEAVQRFLDDLTTHKVAVVRVLFSGAASVTGGSTGVEKHSRGSGGDDLRIIVDDTMNVAVLGEQLADTIRKLKT